MNTTDFTYRIFNARTPGSEARPWIERTYRMWHSVWLEAFQQLDGVNRLHSDDFTRHEQVGALFNGLAPVGSIFYSSVDLSKQIWRDDAYFKAWPEETLTQIGKTYPGTSVLIGCYFTLAPEWRRNTLGFSAKDLLAAMAVEHFLAGPYSVMTGTMRVDRGMNRVTGNLGATTIHQGIKLHGVDVDLILFEREKMIRQEMAREIFSRRMDYTVDMQKPKLRRAG